IRCRLYSTWRSKPLQVAVATRCGDRIGRANRYPFVESLLDEAVLQPYVHDCLVRVHEGGVTHDFRIFFKRHCLLRINQSL
ncbi:hypothetical protein BV22DRAFT_986628, partial [Leucogyrophana mollusca]